jgi:ADP-ribose pyrophosphatase
MKAIEVVYQAPKFQVLRKRIPGRNGEHQVMEYVRHPGAVVVLPLVSDDEILMIRNFRHALDAELWELPAGTLDQPGEPPETAAARELEEEAGWRAGRLERLCEFYPSPGIMDELIRAFVARDLTRTEQRLEPMERIVVEEISRGRAFDMIRDGCIRDAKTIITLLRWRMEG